MKTKLTLLVTGVLNAIVLSGSLTPVFAQVAPPPPEPFNIADVRGSVRIQLALPCGDPVDQTETIAGGSMDIKQFMAGDVVMFDLTRLDMFLTPFEVHRECDGVNATAAFRQIELRLAGAIRFPGEDVGSSESRLFRFTLPKEDFLIYESVEDNAPVPQPETRYQRPSEDVFGVIDVRRKTVQLHVVLAAQVHLVAGPCVRGKCLIDQAEDVTQTADIKGAPSCNAELSDTTPPTVSCTADGPPGNSFLVLAADDGCDAPTITLGPYPLGNGEVIQLQVTGRPGVRLLDTARENVRHFQVGRGEAVITATDAAGNTATATCQ